MQPQVRVRKMRKPGRRPHDDPRETYFDPDLRAARKAAERAAERDNQVTDTNERR